jgi:hypothetical protein
MDFIRQILAQLSTPNREVNSAAGCRSTPMTGHLLKDLGRGALVPDLQKNMA